MDSCLSYHMVFSKWQASEPGLIVFYCLTVTRWDIALQSLSISFLNLCIDQHYEGVRHFLERITINLLRIDWVLSICKH